MSNQYQQGWGRGRPTAAGGWTAEVDSNIAWDKLNLPGTTVRYTYGPRKAPPKEAPWSQEEDSSDWNWNGSNVKEQPPTHFERYQNPAPYESPRYYQEIEDFGTNQVIETSREREPEPYDYAIDDEHYNPDPFFDDSSPRYEDERSRGTGHEYERPRGPGYGYERPLGSEYGQETGRGSGYVQQRPRGPRYKQDRPRGPRYEQERSGFSRHENERSRGSWSEESRPRARRPLNESSRFSGSEEEKRRVPGREEVAPEVNGTIHTAVTTAITKKKTGGPLTLAARIRNNFVNPTAHLVPLGFANPDDVDISTINKPVQSKLSSKTEEPKALPKKRKVRKPDPYFQAHKKKRREGQIKITKPYYANATLPRPTENTACSTPKQTSAPPRVKSGPAPPPREIKMTSPHFQVKRRPIKKQKAMSALATPREFARHHMVDKKKMADQTHENDRNSSVDEADEPMDLNGDTQESEPLERRESVDRQNYSPASPPPKMVRLERDELRRPPKFKLRVRPAPEGWERRKKIKSKKSGLKLQQEFLPNQKNPGIRKTILQKRKAAAAALISSQRSVAGSFVSQTNVGDVASTTVRKDIAAFGDRTSASVKAHHNNTLEPLWFERNQSVPQNRPSNKNFNNGRPVLRKARVVLRPLSATEIQKCRDNPCVEIPLLQSLLESEESITPRRKRKPKYRGPKVHHPPPLKPVTVIGPRDVVANLGLGKIKIESDYIPPVAVKAEPTGTENTGNNEEEEPLGDEFFGGQVLNMAPLIVKDEPQETLNISDVRTDQDSQFGHEGDSSTTRIHTKIEFEDDDIFKEMEDIENGTFGGS